MDILNNSRRGKLVHSLLDEAASEVPNSYAVRDAVGAWTYAELVSYSYAVEAVLEQRGVRPGDRVITHLTTTRELVALFFGVSRRGAVFVPLNTAMKPFHLRSVIENSEPSLVVAGESTVDSVREVTDVLVDGFDSFWLDVEAARVAGRQGEPVAVAPDDIAVLIYTSGSTAAPKGVIGPHRQVTFATWSIQTVLGYRNDDVVFCRFPMSWDYGLYKVLLSCAGRSEIVLAGTESDLQLLKRMREVGATIVPIVPSLATMIATLAERADGKTAPVRMFTNTGAALPATTIVKLREHFPGTKVVRQFGQTESKRIAIMPPEEDLDRPDACGKAMPGTRVLIMDADGNEVPTGVVGEIVATGPHVMPGYWRNPELTARSFRPDPETGERRLHTGDYGRLDEDGYLYFEGRRDDMFKRKGIRMSTVEIEAAAMDIPGVRAAGAVPPTEHRDLAVCVESELDAHVVLRELAKRLEPQKVPAICHVVESFPLTAHGKNATKELAALLDGTRS